MIWPCTARYLIHFARSDDCRAHCLVFFCVKARDIKLRRDAAYGHGCGLVRRPATCQIRVPCVDLCFSLIAHVAPQSFLFLQDLSLLSFVLLTSTYLNVLYTPS